MMRKGSIKETVAANSRRFAAATDVGKGQKESGVQTDQPYREEVEHPRKSGADAKTVDTNDVDCERDAGKTTKRTE